MNEEKFWLMNNVPVVIAMDFKNQINFIHDSFTIFQAKFD